MWFFEMIRALGVGLKAGFQLARGIFYLSRLKQPIVAVFGGKRASKGNVDLENIRNISGLLVKQGYSVITGGGPGVMQEANCAAFKKAEELGIKKRVTLGIAVTGVDEDFDNPCSKIIRCSYFFVRKWLLTRYSKAIIIFPGGIGTADELFNTLNLLKLHKIQKTSIILVDQQYWKSLISWIDHAIDKGFIPAETRRLIYVTDDVSEVMSIVKKTQ